MTDKNRMTSLPSPFNDVMEPLVPPSDKVHLTGYEKGQKVKEEKEKRKQRMKEYPFEPPQHTQFPNGALEYIMPKVSGSVWKVISFATRQTRGWHKEFDEISWSQFMKGTGLSRAALSKALKTCIGDGYLVREQTGTGRWKKPIYAYSLNREYRNLED